ncbi:hypothetical protein ZHAS_00017474 [Anopheles sinensis]|uniref:Uncharacterized protein n=1 Tax=Anopheles sinensis TaxID=74873 RepID=A0A084WGN2_ANOSI|nr:hypothetical protein ZHAS_00017474 [Anopheles sinensis]
MVENVGTTWRLEPRRELSFSCFGCRPAGSTITESPQRIMAPRCPCGEGAGGEVVGKGSEG